MTGVTFGEVKRGTCDTVVIIGGGGSLRGFDFNLIPEDAHIIAINKTAAHIPRYDTWFTLDPWGLHGPQLPSNRKKVSLYAAVSDDYGTMGAKNPSHRVRPAPGIVFLHRLISHNRSDVSSKTAYSLTLSEDPRCISTGNSGYGALNLAYHMRPKNIILLGIDGDVGYFFDGNGVNGSLGNLRDMFRSAKPQLDAAGIRVINGSPNSTVDCWERTTPTEAIRQVYPHHVPTAPQIADEGLPTVVACVLKPSQVYTSDYVNNLAKGVKRNTTVPIEFVCYCTDDTGIDRSLVDTVVKISKQYSGWWNKIELFNTANFHGRKIVFFDLDTIILGNIDEVLSYDHYFTGLRDFYKLDRFASGVLAWKQVDPKIYVEFHKKPSFAMRSCTGGDQEFISKCIGNKHEFFQDLFPGKFVSLKADCGYRENRLKVPASASVLCFHGIPKPHEMVGTALYDIWTGRNK